MRASTLDTIIIGGGAAGLTAALILGRFRRQVALLDTGQQANRVSHAAHGFFTRDGTPPAELIAIGQGQLARYTTVRLLHSAAAAVDRLDEGGFAVRLADGETLTARTLLLATGLRDALPSVPGIDTFWGRSVFHCPYCDGWERRDQPLAVVNDGPAALHTARLLRPLTADLVICTHGASALNADERAALDAEGIGLIETPIARLLGADGQLESIVFADGQTLDRRALFVRLESTQAAPFAAQLGCRMTASGLVEADELGRTSAPGVYAAGDLANRIRQVAMAVAGGAAAAAGINTDLLAADSPHPRPAREAG